MIIIPGESKKALYLKERDMKTISWIFKITIIFNLQ